MVFLPLNMGISKSCIFSLSKNPLILTLNQSIGCYIVPIVQLWKSRLPTAEELEQYMLQSNWSADDSGSSQAQKLGEEFRSWNEGRLYYLNQYETMVKHS